MFTELDTYTNTDTIEETSVEINLDHVSLPVPETSVEINQETIAIAETNQETATAETFSETKTELVAETVIEISASSDKPSKVDVARLIFEAVAKERKRHFKEVIYYLLASLIVFIIVLVVSYKYKNGCPN